MAEEANSPTVPGVARIAIMNRTARFVVPAIAGLLMLAAQNCSTAFGGDRPAWQTPPAPRAGSPVVQNELRFVQPRPLGPAVRGFSTAQAAPVPPRTNDPGPAVGPMPPVQPMPPQGRGAED